MSFLIERAYQKFVVDDMKPVLLIRSAFALNVALSYPIRCITYTVVSIFSGGEGSMKLDENENRNYFEHG